MRKNTSRVEFIITISIENRIKSNKNFGHVLRAMFFFIVIIISILGNKSKKRMTCNVRNGLKFGKICKKVILYTKM